MIYSFSHILGGELQADAQESTCVLEASHGSIQIPAAYCGTLCTSSVTWHTHCHSLGCGMMDSVMKHKVPDRYLSLHEVRSMIQSQSRHHHEALRNSSLWHVKVACLPALVTVIWGILRMLYLGVSLGDCWPPMQLSSIACLRCMKQPS